MSHVLNKPIQIYFEDLSHLGDGVLGIAKGSEDDNRIEIAIDPNHWARMNDLKRTTTMYHELSHDILNAAHVKSKQGHLMYPAYTFDSTVDLVLAVTEIFKQYKEGRMFTFDALHAGHSH